MCGIIGYLSNTLSNHTLKILFEGLKQLQNRGYDSAGISYIQNNEIQNIKYASTKNEDALQKLYNNIDFDTNISLSLIHI